MASNIYTKNEILQNLASKGYFIDVYTLETFFTKWNIEAIFEDEQGGEFYDKNALNTVLNNLFNAKNEDNNKDASRQITPQPTIEENQQQIQNKIQKTNYTLPRQGAITTDEDTQNILQNISLSDGSSLMNKIQSDMNVDIDSNANAIEPVIDIQEAKQEIQTELDGIIEAPKKNKKMGILEGALADFDPNVQKQSLRNPEQEQEILQEIEKMEKTIEDFQEQTEQIVPENNTLNIQESTPPMPPLPTEEGNQEEVMDDISLISDSLEAQEKFKEYVVNEIAKKQVPPPPPQNSNEFKLDISERTINMIARTMAKKIAKHVSAICSADAKSAAELEEIKQENKKLEQKAKDLENQNKKLRLLLAESNKNLNSYKPSIFGLYKKEKNQ